MVICVDIDGTLTNETEGHDYANRTPNIRIINRVKKWKNEGNLIIIHSARWTVDETATRAWLMKHEVPFDVLLLGKPKCDLYVDDKAMRPEEIV